MFEQTFVQDEGGVKPWTLVVSLLGQSSLIGMTLLVPLIFTLEIPIQDLANHILLIAPSPPPPPPQAPEPQTRAAAPAPRPPSRYEVKLQAPREIPEEVAVVSDIESASHIPGPNLGGMMGGVPGGIPGGVLSLTGHGSMDILPPAPIRVGGNVQAARLTHRVMPVYPEQASEDRLAGTVKLEAIITREGTVRKLRVVEGHPLLADAAVEAVRQWQYRPTLLNGAAVEVFTLIAVTFQPRALTPKEEKELRKRQKKKS